MQLIESVLLKIYNQRILWMYEIENIMLIVGEEENVSLISINFELCKRRICKIFEERKKKKHFEYLLL